MKESRITPSVIKSRLASWQYVAKAIIDGLNGEPFSWGGGEFQAYRLKAEAMGITLVTKTAIEKRGRRLKRGVKPVGEGYFYAPISRRAKLYVLECQTAVSQEATDAN
jgi:hypothetical protein